MTENQPKPSTPSSIEARSFADVLAEMIGETLVVSNPESFEEGALGPQIRSDFYRAKLIGMGQDYLVLVIKFSHGDGKRAEWEPARQYLPLSRVKRLSKLKNQAVLHL